MGAMESPTFGAPHLESPAFGVFLLHRTKKEADSTVTGEVYKVL